MSKPVVVCVLRRLVTNNELWSDEETGILPYSKWRVCMKYLVEVEALQLTDGGWGAYIPIGVLIPLEVDDGVQTQGGDGSPAR